MHHSACDGVKEVGDGVGTDRKRQRVDGPGVEPAVEEEDMVGGARVDLRAETG